MTESFEDLMVGPLTGIETIEEKAQTLHDIFNKGMFVLAFITDTKHEVLIEFEQNLETIQGRKIKIAGVFITAYY